LMDATPAQEMDRRLGKVAVLPPCRFAWLRGAASIALT
jgi:hypothetical protein